ncbi:MAG: dUTP diphosphatase [bacterium]|nr:dUTP diphosphatase [bacterium]
MIFKKIDPKAKLPQLSTDGSSGYDIYVCRVLDKETRAVISNLEKPIMIRPGESILFGSGIALEIPPTLHAIVVSRSGLSAKHDIEVGNPGAPIDSDYRGEFTILWRNFGKERFEVVRFMKIAQLVFHPRILVKWVESIKLSKTEKGDKGHGSTGLY